MPIYEFSCADCRTVFSFFSRRVNTKDVPKCPRCSRPLSRNVSLFSARTGKSDSDPLGLGDDGLDEDFPDVPDFDPDDERVARAIGEMGSRLDRLDPSNPAEAARTIREFSEKSGVRLNDRIMSAMGRIAAGDETEGAARELAEAVESGHLLDEIRKAGGARDAGTPFAHDPTLYDM